MYREPSPNFQVPWAAMSTRIHMALWIASSRRSASSRVISVYVKPVLLRISVDEPPAWILLQEPFEALEGILALLFHLSNQVLQGYVECSLIIGEPSEGLPVPH